MTIFAKMKDLLKIHGYHFIFILSLLCLASLVAWWTVFIHNSIRVQRSLQYKSLESTLTLLSFRAGMDRAHPPEPGVLKEDTRFEIVPCNSTAGKLSVLLLPYWPGYFLRPQPAALQQIEAEFHRRKVMLIGESSVLIFVVFIATFFLYQYIQLERKTAHEVKELWGRLTHEIKTPITGIKAFLESLKNQSLRPEELPPYVDMALKQVQEQEKIAENILAGYHLRSVDASLTLTRVSLKEFLRRTLSSHPIRLSDAKAHFHFPEKKDVFVLADECALKVIFDNIADNAMKYASPGLVLTIAAETEKNAAVVSFLDNGPGFPKGREKDVFRAYKFLGRNRFSSQSGSGMGLFISQQLARKMGGDLKAVAQKGKQGVLLQLVLNLAKDS